MVWFRGQPRRTGQIKFSLKFQAGHGSPGEGCGPEEEGGGEGLRRVGKGSSLQGPHLAVALAAAAPHAPLCAGGWEDLRGSPPRAFLPAHPEL